MRSCDTAAPVSRATVTACLIVKDEEVRLPAALETVAFCDEIVVVDSGSADRTPQIARAAGAKVIENPWPGFGGQRNVAIDHATGDWILEVDADERVSPLLRREIEDFLAGPPPADANIGAQPQRDWFLGAPLSAAGKYPKYRYRFFRRGAYRHDELRTVHEGLWSREPVVVFEGDFEHVLAGNWREALKDVWNYAKLEESQQVSPSGAAQWTRRLVLRPPLKFAYRLVIEGGWRDGWRGATKIGLDCASDVMVWTRVLARPAGEGPDPGDVHGLGARLWLGPPRLVGVAGGPADVRPATAWLVEAAAAGADVAIVSDVAPPPGIRGRRVPDVGPLYLIRALDAEEQLRPYDAVVPFGRRARVLTRLLRGRLAGPYGVIEPGDPREIVERMTAAAVSSADPAT